LIGCVVIAYARNLAGIGAKPTPACVWVDINTG